MITSLFVLFNLLMAHTSSQCLSSPPEIVWAADNSAQMTFDAATISLNNNAMIITTRLHNEQLPSPTLRMKAGQQYKLRFINNLGFEQADPTLNIIKEVNYTNIHTHGLHISGESPGDDIFTTINPGQSFEYIYNIPCDHSGGTMWYHPHHMGSTTIQAGGGAAGAIIIDDNDVELRSFPDWYKDLTNTELIMVVQHFELSKIEKFGNNIDHLFSFSGTMSDDFYTINGEYQPTVCLEKNVYRKLRIVHIDIASNAELTINTDSCSIYLLSKDGVLIHGENNEIPRLIPSNTMYFTMASRADVAVVCSAAGRYQLIINDREIIGSIQVTETAQSPTTVPALTTFNPYRPKYLESLLNYNGVYNVETIKTSARSINGETFSSPTKYLFEIESGSVNEWDVSSNSHPFHPHINHMQIQTINGNGVIGPIGWTQRGDWIDTLAGSATIRFLADRFGGKIISHCHILEHEDQGAMAVILINGGCDALYNDFSPSQAGLPPCDSTCGTISPPVVPPASCGLNTDSCSLDSDCCSNKCKRGSCKGN